MTRGFLAPHDALALDTEHLAYESLLDDGVSYCRKNVPLRTGTIINTRQVAVHEGEPMDAYYYIAREPMYGLTAEVKNGTFGRIRLKIG